jgi:hypothetical protein
MGINNNLQQRLDAYVAGACEPQALSDELLAYCMAAPSATWEVLALLDQYHRRGKLPQALHRSISRSIERRALGVYPIELTGSGGRSAAIHHAAADRAVALHAVNASARPDRPAAQPPATTTLDEPIRLASEVLLLRKELQAARSLAAAYLEQLKSHSWQRPAGDTVPRARPAPVPRSSVARPRQRSAPRWPTRSVQTVSVIVFMLAVGASQGLGEREDARLPLPLPAPAAPMHVAAPGRLSLAADTFVVAPGGRSASITVERAGGTDGEVSFRWWTLSAGARAGVDFRGQAGARVSVPAGANSLRLSVPILDNPARRHTELFYVAIGRPLGGATLGGTQRAAVFIVPR